MSAFDSMWWSTAQVAPQCSEEGLEACKEDIDVPVRRTSMLINFFGSGMMRRDDFCHLFRLVSEGYARAASIVIAVVLLTCGLGCLATIGVPHTEECDAEQGRSCFRNLKPAFEFWLHTAHSAFICLIRFGAWDAAYPGRPRFTLAVWILSSLFFSAAWIEGPWPIGDTFLCCCLAIFPGPLILAAQIWRETKSFGAFWAVWTEWIAMCAVLTFQSRAFVSVAGVSDRAPVIGLPESVAGPP